MLHLWTYLEMLTLECDLGISVTELIDLAGVEVVKGPKQQETLLSTIITTYYINRNQYIHIHTTYKIMFTCI